MWESSDFSMTRRLRRNSRIWMAAPLPRCQCLITYRVLNRWMRRLGGCCYRLLDFRPCGPLRRRRDSRKSICGCFGKMAVPSAATEAAETIVADKKWWLGRMGRLGSLIASALAEKRMKIFRNETDRPFVLPDDPVLLVRNGGYPATERQGFFQAHILLPLSSRAVLFLRVPEILWPRDEEKHRTIEVREATIALVDLINSALMSRAARFPSCAKISRSSRRRSIGLDRTHRLNRS